MANSPEKLIEDFLALKRGLWQSIPSLDAPRILPIMGRQIEAPKTMAEVALKPEAIEKALQSIVGKLPKEIAQRQWTPQAHASLIVLIIENSGVKLSAEQKQAAYKNLLDSDVQYTSNMRAYLVKRGILPAKAEVPSGSFLG